MDKMLSSRAAVIIISIIWGFGLALLFRKVCQNNQCVIVKVPPNFYRSGSIIYEKNQCYELHKYLSECVY